MGISPNIGPAGCFSYSRRKSGYIDCLLERPLRSLKSGAVSGSPGKCPSCLSEQWAALPLPHPRRSMNSDLRVVDVPLRRFCCLRCGLATAGSRDRYEQTFTRDYLLYGHAAGQGQEAMRQDAYATWIAETISTPARAFEAGCGNGGLLLALRRRWPQTAFAGVEPAPEAARHARSAGLDVRCAFLTPRDGSAPQYDVAFAANVIEHTADPVGFLRDLSSYANEVAVVCPNGDVPNSELLVADHLFSFTQRNLQAIFARAELDVETLERAPAALGYFHMAVARKSGPAIEARAVDPDAAGAVFRARERYLAQASALEEALLERIGPTKTVICFGAGEAAAILRAYAPRVWERVILCTCDQPPESTFGDRTVVDYAALERSGTMLVATRPAVQERIAQRVRSDGFSTVTWNDLLAS